MDFSKFSDDNFEAKQWVNAALKRKDDKIEIDAHASGLVMKLQLFIQEVNNALEETSAQSLNNMPRVLRELEVIRQEATLLKEQMKLVKDDIKAVEQNTSESMKMLLDLDEVKSRIQSASHALQEADNWATLSSDLDQVFQSGDHKQIADKLVGMSRSLLVLQDVPDYHERQKLLENLKNKLEALLSPKLVSAFNNHSLEESQEYFQIFSDINRLEQLQNYYIRCYKTKLLESWQTLSAVDQSETMLHWLSMFYNGVLSTWHSELTWCGEVFNQPASVLSLLISQTLNHLDPPFSVCLKEYIKDNHYPIKELIDLKQVTLRFSKALQSSVASVKDENCMKAVYSLVQTISSPYIPYLLNYASILTGYLTENLKLIPMDADGFLEITDMLAESVGKIFQLTDHAVESCILLTDGLGFYQLINSLEVFFVKYLDKISDIVENIRNSLKLDDESGELDESTFQHASKLIQVCGSILLKTEEFESSVVEIVHKTCSKWIEFEKKRNISAAEIFDTFNYLKDNNQVEFNTFVEFVQTIENGGGVLTQVIKHIEELNNKIHNLAFDIAFSPLKQQMSSVPKLEVWSKHTSDTGDSLSGDIPSFSLSPLGYITEVGDYLLTLPHQLELFMVQDNPALETALKAGKLQFAQDTSSGDHNPAFNWLSSVTRATLHIYVENILHIPLLTSLANKQLLADMEYLFNILEALEVKPTELIVNVNKLLKAETDEFHILAADLGVEQRIINALHTMRSSK